MISVETERHDASVVDHHVDATEPLNRRIRERSDIFSMRDIRNPTEHINAFRLQASNHPIKC